MRERLVIVFIAIAIGLLLTTLVFFLYQQTKTVPQRVEKGISGDIAKPTLTSETYLVIEEPKDESLADRRLIQVKGKTRADNLIVVSTNQEDIVASPSTDGRFSVSITIAAGANKIVTRAISPSEESVQDTRIVTFSTEEF